MFFLLIFGALDAANPNRIINNIENDRIKEALIVLMRKQYYISTGVKIRWISDRIQHTSEFAAIVCMTTTFISQYSVSFSGNLCNMMSAKGNKCNQTASFCNYHRKEKAQPWYEAVLQLLLFRGLLTTFFLLRKSKTPISFSLLQLSSDKIKDRGSRKSI